MSLTESVDTSTPVGKMVFAILGAVAQMERELTRERVRAGLRQRSSKLSTSKSRVLRWSSAKMLTFARSSSGTTGTEM